MTTCPTQPATTFFDHYKPLHSEEMRNNALKINVSLVILVLLLYNSMSRFKVSEFEILFVKIFSQKQKIKYFHLL